jgi:hypothetical protein
MILISTSQRFEPTVCIRETLVEKRVYGLKVPVKREEKGFAPKSAGQLLYGKVSGTAYESNQLPCQPASPPLPFLCVSSTLCS